jgi:hypothetical protein
MLHSVVRALRRALVPIVLAAVALPAAAVPALRLNMQTPPTFDTGNLGGDGDGSISLSFILLNGETANGPFTAQVELPPHVTYLNFMGSSWTCGAAGSTVTCTYSATLTAANWASSSLEIRLNVSESLPVPGNSTVRATLQSAQVPLPQPLVCPSGTAASLPSSDSQCLEHVVPHRQSTVEVLPETWGHNHAVFEGGTQNSFSVGFLNLGFSQLNGTVAARFLLPPGFVFFNAVGQVTWNCSAGTPDSGGQLITCTTPYFFDGMGPQQANITVRVNVSEDVEVPGPLPIYATISNAAQPPPDFALCDDANPPVGCGYYTIPTLAPRVSRMDIIAMMPQVPSFTVGQAARVRIDYSNIGEGNADGATLSFSMPPGFSYASNTASPPLSCMAVAGTPQSGQTVNCTYAATYPAGVVGWVQLSFDVLQGAPSPGTMFGAASDNGLPGPTLSQCMVDPGDPDPMVGCGRTVLRVAQWLFCDGYEQTPLICGTR